jgi:hypothetical protein
MASGVSCAILIIAAFVIGTLVGIKIVPRPWR